MEREKSDMWRRMMDELQVRSESGTLRRCEREREEGEKAASPNWENCFGIIKHWAQVFPLPPRLGFRHSESHPLHSLDRGFGG